MTLEPFLQLRVRGHRDLLHVRHRARQIAQLLRFTPEEVICTASTSFMVAQRAFVQLGRTVIGFAIADHRLHVFAQQSSAEASVPAELLAVCKPLPVSEQALPGEDIAWLVRQVQQLAPTTLGEEIVRHNQETLQLLVALRQIRGADAGQNPSAA
jgi:hypothetical protein